MTKHIMNVFTDSHCHLNRCQQGQQLIAAAAQAGVRRIVIPAVHYADWSVIRRYTLTAGIFAAYGLHPLYQQAHKSAHLDELEKWLIAENAVAVGECGLDFYVGDTQDQCQTFKAQLMIAKRLHLPVLVHARKSLDMVLKLIKEAGSPRFVIHAFSGSDVQLARILAMGGYIGIGGSSTYPRAQRLQRQLASIAANRYLLETDAPDQPLHGYQGRENHPARIVKIAEHLAGLRGESVAVISKQSEQNCCDFFAW